MKKIALYRIVYIVSMAIKFFLQVVIFQKRNRQQWTDATTSKWESLLKKQAAEYRRTAIKLEGLMIKVGQFLSTRADILPAAFLEELEGLVDSVPPVAWDKAREVLEEEWNHDYGETLHKISIEPVASASIGEVYHGYLHNGDSVAIKIQRPGIEKIIKADFKALKIVLWLAERFTSFGKQTNLPQLYKEIKTVIGNELNFKKELQNGQYFQKRYENFPEVKIPRYYMEYSTQRVLVMEWIEGTKITDLSFLEKHGIDRKELAVNLFKVFLEQLLQDGRFHADPHPGNIMVQSDGIIVLIDFGMVGEIKRSDALAIRDLVQGILLNDYDLLIDALEKMRFLLPHANKELLKKVLSTLINAYVEQNLADMDDFVVEHILEDIQEIVREQPIQLPSEFAFFGRAISTFVGLLYILDPKIDIFEIAKPLVKDWLRGNQEESNRSVLGLVQQYIKPLLGIPKQLEEIANEPRRHHEWMEKHAQVKLEISFIQSKKRDSFWFMCLSAIGSYTGYLFQESHLTVVSLIVFVIALFFYTQAHRAYRRLAITNNRKDDEHVRRKGSKTHY